jgi:hypothetical protein
MKKITFVYSSLIVSLLLGCNSFAIQTKFIELEEYKRIDNPARDEVSGIIKSHKVENQFWVHGDSGQKDNIYPINRDGEVLGEKKEGIEIDGAKNKDWEDIAIDEQGNLIIADVGNNCRCRNDLKLFVIPEPDVDDENQKVGREYDIKYPKRNTLGELLWKESPDAEAVFVMGGKIRIITKERTTGRLYTLENPSEGKENLLTETAEFKFGRRVTAADYSAEHSLLAVLTTSSLWLFEVSSNQGVFDGKKSETRFKGVKQIEAITFDGDGLIITEEEGELYRINLDEVNPLRQD